MKVPLTIRIINLTSPESVSSPYASWITILPFMEIRFPSRRKKEARQAITPSPPIWMRISTTICPNSVYCSAGITVTSPVTQTEVTEVNSASINSIGFWLHTGSQRITPPKKITPKKPSATICIVFSLTLLGLFSRLSIFSSRI